MKLSDFKVLTFDTHGTLIDWETGTYHGLAPLVEKAGLEARSRDDNRSGVEPPIKDAGLSRRLGTV